MAKKKTVTYVCSECGEDFPKWYGKCPSCGAFNSFKEFREAKLGAGSSELEAGVDLLDCHPDPGLDPGEGSASGINQADSSATPQNDKKNIRIKTGISECDRVLGDGFFPGSLILFGGHPGIGKSTLALQIFARLTQAMYFSGEESREQVTSRLRRICHPDPGLDPGEGSASGISQADSSATPQNDSSIFSTNSLEDLVATVQKHNPPLVVVDSIQMIGREGGNFGSMTQIRESAEVLLKLAKSTGSVILLIGHVTKNDELAGPKVLEHLVDAVLYLEGDRNTDLRILKSPKNRFGSTMEVGVFQMHQSGLQPLENPSEFFINQRLPGSHGSAITVVREGVRNFLLEIQALTIKTNFGNPRRTSHGLDLSKLHLLLAVVSKFTPFKCYEYDVYVNVVGGVRVGDQGSDLAVCAAIMSSHLEKEIPADTVLFGEVGLSGEVRRVTALESRIKEAEKLGFKKIVCPKINNANNASNEIMPANIKVEEISSIRQLVKVLWEKI